MKLHSTEEDLLRGELRREVCTGNFAEKVIVSLVELGNARGEGDMLHNVRKIGWVVEGRGFYSQS